MMFNLACVAALTAAGFTSALPGWFDNQAVVIPSQDDLLNVPGQNPLEFCDNNRGSDIVSIVKVDLSPNPPKAGAELEIIATGTVYEPILDGAYIDLVVKYGLIKLVNQRADLCEQTEKADLKCPIEKGDLTVKKTVEIPSQVPPGRYNVIADVYNKDGKRITCLHAYVVFGGSSTGEDL